MTFSDQAAGRRQDGRVTDQNPADGPPAKPRRRTFPAAYKARILAAYEALPEGSAERGALLRKERLYHSHIEAWRKKAAEGGSPAENARNSPAAGGADDELKRLREENRRLKSENERQAARAAKLSGQLDRTKAALDIAGKAFALLEGISDSVDAEEK
ncbi:transposase [Streptomyces sp. NPDC057540]|uniref:transposase n=1 Tax=Streptomyces sp. NPDC057540 TaxID=3346160 RepID=UPI00367E9B7E